MHYAFSFDGDAAHCREGYEDAAAIVAHLENVRGVLQRALAVAEITWLGVHGPPVALAKLRKPFENRKPQMFAGDVGFGGSLRRCTRQEGYGRACACGMRATSSAWYQFWRSL
jgi:hypothetical protein